MPAISRAPRCCRSPTCRRAIAEVLPDSDAPLLLHCAVGARSLRAATCPGPARLHEFVNLPASLDWLAPAGGAWEAPEQLLTPAQQRRYSRQTLIPEIGQEGQRRLLDSRVLLIGAGGLGSPVALYLAASGIGTIGLVDDDVVDESNLQRQVLHTVGPHRAAEDRIGADHAAGTEPGDATWSSTASGSTPRTWSG